MTRTLGQVAEDPEVGDVVVMRTGHIRYRVVDLVASHKVENGVPQFERIIAIKAVRLAVRSSPHIGEKEQLVQVETWWDLVTYGAASLE